MRFANQAGSCSGSGERPIKTILVPYFLAKAIAVSAVTPLAPPVTIIDDIRGKDVLIVEDIIDTGRTLALLKEQLLKRGPASLKICTAFDKPDRRVTELVPDYNGITIPDKFIVGYGLDLDGEYRNFDDIRVVRQE